MSNPFDIPEVLESYGEKYHLGGYDRDSNRVQVTIFERDYTGEVTELDTVSEDPIELQFSYADGEFFRPISGSSCRFAVQAKEHQLLWEMQSAKEYDMYVEVEVDESLVFTGYLRPASYRQQYGVHYPEINLEATDGLGLLRNRKFTLDQDHPTYGIFWLKDIASYLLYMAGNRNNWYDRTPYRGVSTDAFNFMGTAQIPIVDFYEKSMYDVLEGVMDLMKTNICMVNGKYIVRANDSPDFGRVEEYTVQGDYDGVSSILPTKIFLQDRFKAIRGSLRSDIPVRQLVITHQQDYIENLVWNGDFTKGKDLDYQGVLIPWARGWNPVSASPTNFRVLENIMHIPRHSAGSTGRVEANMARGTANSMRTIIEVELRVSEAALIEELAPAGAEWKWYFHYSVGYTQNGETPEIVSKEVEGPNWQTIEFEVPTPFPFTADDGASFPLRLYGWTRQDVYPPGYDLDNMDLQINSIAVKRRKSGLGDINQQDTIHYSENNFGDATHSIEKNTGNPYTYTGNARTGYNIAGFGQLKTLRQWISDRLDWFYQINRVRISFSGILEEGPLLNGVNQVYDKYIIRRHIVLSQRIRLISRETRVEVIEYEPYTPTLEPQDKWILEDGTWDMTGVWMMNETWNF